MSPDFWKNKKVFLTGHTGFKGAWLSLYLKSMGAEVTGFALPPPVSEPNLYSLAQVDRQITSIYGDIRHATEVESALKNSNAEIVIHLAAQALVRTSYADPIGTYSTNIMGLLNVFEAVKGHRSTQAVINVTSDKCYENQEWHWGYRENDAMGGYDPYSNSKGCAELITSAYRRSYFHALDIPLATARSGNVIGGGDWSTDRILPDIMKSIQSHQPIVLRNPLATRPWQHVLDPLTGYLTLAEKLSEKDGQEYAEAWNFGPADNNSRSVQEVVETTLHLWPSTLEWRSASIANPPHEAHYLKLDCSKSFTKLNWHPIWEIDESLRHTVSWYRSYINKESILQTTLDQIAIFKSNASIF